MSVPAPQTYRPRWQQPSVLQQVLVQHLPGFIEDAQQHDRSVPDFVRKELEAIARCGDPTQGLTRWRCTRCDHERVLPWRCKSSLCCTCGGRRMAEKTAYLVELLPHVPMRQFVITFPFPLRYLLAYDAALCGQVMHCVARCIFSWQRRRAKQLFALASVEQAHCGAFTAVQRARSDLRSSVHGHTIAFDGVYVAHDDAAGNEQLTFRPLPPPGRDDLERIAGRVSIGVAALLARRGLPDGNADSDPCEDPVMVQAPLFSECTMHSMRGIVTAGPRRGQRLLHLESLSIPPDLRKQRSDAANVDGFNLHASSRTAAHDYRGLERMVRYVLRPPIARERLSWLEDGRVRYHLKRRFDDGTRAVIYDPKDFVSKLVPLVPRPYFNELRYYGLLAPASKRRAAIVRDAPATSETPRQLKLFGPAIRKARRARSTQRKTRYRFHELMKRTFEIDIDHCDRCNLGRMRLMEVVTDRDAIDALLYNLGHIPEPQRPPPPARAPPQLTFPFAG